MMLESTKDRPKISVIMPVYNSRIYIKDAVRTIIGQDFQDFELLLVDDGSTDGSGEACDAIAKTDERILVIHKQNGGQCDARNIGIEAARGDYIAFCDNDDECLPGFLSENYSIAVQDDSDCVRFGRTLQRIAENGSLLRETTDVPPSRAAFDLKELSNCPDYWRYYFFGSNGVWNGFYRREMLLENNIKFDVRLRHGFEDTLFNDYVYRVSQRTSFNDKSYYIWKRRAAHSSSMMGGSDDQLLGLALVLKEEHAFLSTTNLFGTNAAFCVNRLMMHAKDLLTIDFYSTFLPSFSDELELYRKLHDIYKPYYDSLKEGKGEYQYAFIRDALMNEKYKRLYYFIKAGVMYRRIASKK